MAKEKNLGVRDLLQSSKNRSNYEMLMTEIRDLVLREKQKDEQNHIKNDEGRKKAFNLSLYTMKDLMYPGDGIETHDKDTLMIRHEPFGKRINADRDGGRMKKMIYSTNGSPRIAVDPPPPLEHLISHEKGDRVSTFDVSIYEALVEDPVSTEMQQVKACMSYLNKIRLHLKKCNYESNLFTLGRHFKCANKGRLMNFDEFMLTLKKANINLDQKMFGLLLDKFDLMSNHCMVDYNEALKLLYWKCEMPPLPRKHYGMHIFSRIKL